MGTYIHYTDEQKERANTVDLVELLWQRGEKLLRSGREYRLENDHSITVRGSEWYDHDSRQGGHAVSFVQHYYGMSYQEAMEFLLKGTYPVTSRREMEPPKPFALPPPHQNMRRVYAYLMKQRQIDGAIITHFVRKGLLYEDAQYHNCVFVGADEGGAPATPTNGAPTAGASPSRSMWREAAPSTASTMWGETICSMCLRRPSTCCRF